jgi:hypothetical protein
MSDKRPQDRAADGRYTFDGRLDRVCVCGHTFGNHGAATPHECFLHTMPEATDDERLCRCPKFRPSRKKRT